MPLLLSLAFAAPVSLPIQGALSGPDGVPVSGAQTITLRLYADAAGGAAFWDDTQTVQFAQGAFAALVGADGELTDAQLIADDTVWVSVEFGGAESARVPVGAAPYAVAARWAATAGAAETAVTANTANTAGFATTAGAASTATSATTAATATNALSLGGQLADRYVLDNEAIPWSRIDLAGAPGFLPGGYAAGAGLRLTGTTFEVKTEEFRPSTWVPAWTEITGVPADVTNRNAATLAGQSLTDLDTRYGSGGASLDTGVLSFGAAPGGGYGHTGVYGVQIEFGRSFSVAPVLVAAPHEINDNGAISTRVIQHGRSGAFTRAYCNGQELQPDRLAWFAFEPGSHTIDGRVIHAGRINGGGTAAGGTTGTYSATFPTAYAAPPVVFVNVDESGDNNGPLGCRVISVSTTGFSVNCFQEAPIQQMNADGVFWVSVPATGSDPIDYRGRQIQAGVCTTPSATGSCSFSVPFANGPTAVVGQVRDLDNSGAVTMRTTGLWTKTGFSYRNYVCGSGDAASEQLFWLAAD